ncbi:MAG: helix-turn-helix transcriptional regulator [Clostridia bacterium]|nr:helix-turn-helix transcriptional regulator [Clostridia bacterium]
MNNFQTKLNELITEQGISKRQLANILGFKENNSSISKWTKGQQMPKLDTAIKLSNHFKCSLDYLFGTSNNSEEVNYKTNIPFDKRLRKILSDKKITQTKLVEDTNFSTGNLFSWFNKKSQPNMSTVIELAEYLNVSLDYLAGRE